MSRALLIVLGVVIVGLAGCRVLGVDDTVPCDDDGNCDPDERCVDGFCAAAAAEGEGEEGEGEGEEGEGEGEGDVGEGEGEGDAGEGEGEGDGDDVVLVEFGDSGFDRVDLDALFVDGTVPANGVVRGCADLCDVQPVVDDAQAIALAGRPAVQDTAARLDNGGNVVETVFRAPSDGGFATVLSAIDGNDGWLAVVEGDELVVSGGDRGCVFAVQRGAWHHLLCAGRNVGGVRCALDGADDTCDAGDGELLSVGTLRPVSLAVGSSSDVSDAAVAVARAWNADLSRENLLVSGNLGRLLQRRLLAGLGVTGPASRQESTTSIVGPPRFVAPAADRLVLTGAEWPRVVAGGPRLGDARALFFEPRATNLFALDNVSCERDVRAGVEGCVVTDRSEFNFDVPAGASAISFFADVDVDVVIPGIADPIPIGEQPLDCVSVGGFTGCAVPEDATELSARPTGPGFVTGLQLEAGPSTTSAGPETGDARAADRLDVVVPGGRQSLVLRLRRVASVDAAIGTLRVVNENATDDDCVSDEDCAASEVCDVDAFCHAFTGNNVVKIVADVARVGSTAVGAALGDGVVTLVVKGPGGAASCDGVDGDCRVLVVAGRPGRFEFGDPGANRSGADAGWFLLSATASP